LTGNSGRLSISTGKCRGALVDQALGGGRRGSRLKGEEGGLLSASRCGLKAEWKETTGTYEELEESALEKDCYEGDTLLGDRI